MKPRLVNMRPTTETKTQRQYRNVCFTLNNYGEGEVDRLFRCISYSYMVIGREVGKSGTKHLQGYVEFQQKPNFLTVKAHLGKAHFEPRYATSTQAAQYCMKDGDYQEDGVISHAGRRKDLELVYHMVKEGKSDIQIGEAFPGTYMRFYKAIDRVRFNYAQTNNKFEEVEVHVRWGAAGTGKTRYVVDTHPGHFRLNYDKELWFDGYTNQEVILIDDFYGNIGYGAFLQLTDGYKYSLPIKGAFTWKQWKKVYITSNKHPREWFKEGWNTALERRFTTITEVGVLVLPPTSGSPTERGLARPTSGSAKQQASWPPKVEPRKT